MIIETRAELATFGALLVAAIGELEELNDVLEVALGVEAVDQPRARPFHQLRTMLGFRPSQLSRAATLVPVALEALAALPSDVELPAVGLVIVKSAQTNQIAPTWVDRLVATANRRAAVTKVQEVRAELGGVLGDLERARIRARLAAMRLDST